jgi:tRNA pseudouridine55 synthase
MVRKLSGERRVGHAGTLDPAATGVLPVCLGRGTRIIEFLMATTKTYRARIEMGRTTDTYDITGEITRQKDSSDITRDRLEAALKPFRGIISQIPPMYSAVKYRGQPLYQMARAGIDVERESRPAQIYRLELKDWQPPIATIEVECGKGTYIRSLAHDLGESLGCGAALDSLVRIRCGIFDIDNAISLPRLEDAFLYGYWQRYLYPIDSVLSAWPVVVVGDDAENEIKHGSPVSMDDNDEKVKTTVCEKNAPVQNREYCRAYTTDGRFLGTLYFDAERKRWQPKKVFI